MQHRTILTGCVSFCLAVTGALDSASAREARPATPLLYLVTAPTVDLYQTQRLIEQLREGQIVSGKTLSKDAEWLEITYQGKTFEAPRKSFISNEDTAVAEARKLADLDNQLLGLTQKIDAGRERLKLLFYASSAVRFDSVLLYRILLPPQPAAEQPGGPAPVPGRQSATNARQPPQYQYENKVTPPQANRQLRDFAKEFTQVAAATEKNMSDRLNLLKDRAAYARLAAQRRERFERYAADPNADYRAETYVAMTDRIQLFTGQQLATTTLPQDTVITATPVLKDPTWLVLWYQDKEYTSEARSFRSRGSLEEEAASRQTVGAQEIADLEGVIADTLERTKILGTMQLPLASASSAKYVPLQRPPFAADFPGCALYPLPRAPSQDATEVIDATRARHLSNELAEDIKGMLKQVDQMRRQAGELKKDVAGSAPKLQNLLKRMDQATTHQGSPPATAPVPKPAAATALPPVPFRKTPAK